mmetsp:Transcript_23952/g.21786  ORF Transcript_23952/g.21786 Transcript_23952/m.21786 type:complete len:146 (+) Transcript_23952:3-440(+)
MYNGIGVSTARGTATNGYVTKNQASLKPKSYDKHDKNKNDKDLKDKPKQINEELLNHRKKRLIESKLFELEDELIEKGYSEDIIQEKLNKLRIELENNKFQDNSNSTTDTHAINEKKEAHNKRMKEALGLKDKVDDDDIKVIANK